MTAPEPTPYTPTTEQVRNNMAFGAAYAVVALRTPDVEMQAQMRDIDWPIPGLRERTKAQFDRWLAAHDEQVRAEALREVHAAINAEDWDIWEDEYRQGLWKAAAIVEVRIARGEGA